MAAFEGFLGRLAALWSGMTGGQRVVLASMAAALIISVLIFSMWIRKPDMAVLATGIDLSEASDVIKELEESGVEYTVTDGGRTVLVPKDMVSELRVLLASSHAFGGAQMGYELFDNEKLGITEFAQKVNLQRALEGELSRTISELRAVDKARVHIAIPKESVFLDEEKHPTASVVVKLRAGNSLSSEQIHGIANLVSFSVEGLDPSCVSIVDDTGNVLKGETNGLETASTAQLDEQQTIEQYLSQKAEGLLSKVVGRGRAKVGVSVRLNWEQLERTKEYYDPERSSVRSEERNESSSTTEGSTTESVVTNYELDKTIEHVLSAVGTIEQLSAAVFVDDRAIVDEQGGVTYQQRTDEELRQLEDVVKNAVGFDANRGDRITVVNMRFSSDRLLDEGGGFFSSPLYRVLPSLIGKLIAIVIALVLFLAVRKQLRAGPGRRTAGGRGGPAGGSMAAMSSPEAFGELSFEDRVRGLATGNPENAANLMRSWITESREEP